MERRRGDLLVETHCQSSRVFQDVPPEKSQRKTNTKVGKTINTEVQRSDSLVSNKSHLDSFD